MTEPQSQPSGFRFGVGCVVGVLVALAVIVLLIIVFVFGVAMLGNDIRDQYAPVPTPTANR